MHDQDTFARPRSPADAISPVPPTTGTAETAMETAKVEARNVAETAKQEAGAVVDEAKGQMRRLASEAGDQVRTRVHGQHGQLVDRIRQTANELSEMAGGGNTATRAVVADVADRGNRLADYLADRGPEGLLADVQGFARRRPGTFLAGALVAGFLVGRLGKNLYKARSDRDQPAYRVEPTPAVGYTVTEPVPTVYQSAAATGVDAYGGVTGGGYAGATGYDATGVPVEYPSADPLTAPMVEPVTPSPYASESYAGEVPAYPADPGVERR